MSNETRHSSGVAYAAALFAVVMFFVFSLRIGEDISKKMSFPPATFTPGPAPTLPAGIPENTFKIPANTEVTFGNRVNEQLRICNYTSSVSVEGTTVDENSFSHDCNCVAKIGEFTLYLTEDADGAVFIQIPEGWDLIPTPL